jgi:hypothetical protein
MSRIRQAVRKAPDEAAPAAAGTYWFKCDECENLHVVLEDASGEALATMTLDEEMLADMVATIRADPQEMRH